MNKIPSFYKSSFVFFSISIVILGIITFGSLSELMLDAYDDRDHLVDSANIFQNWKHLFSPHRIVEIRPPIDMLFLFGYFFWGEDPSGYHVVEVVLHIIATLILAYAFIESGADKNTAYLSALFFFMNVSHHRAMHQITTVTYLMALIFGLLVFICFSRYLIHHTRIWMLVALIFLAISVFSHPSMISVVLFCCYLSWRKQKDLFFIIRSVWPLGVLSGVLVSLVFLASWHGDQVLGVVSNPDIRLLLSKPFWYFGRLWGNAHWIGPTLFHGQPVVWEVLLGSLYCLCILLLYRKKIFPAADWAVWSFITILPFLNYPLFLMELGPSRHLYIPSAGSSFVLCWGIQQVVRRFPISFQKWSLIGIVAVIIMMSFVSLKRVEAYSYYRSGRGYIAEGNHVLGEKQLSKAVDIDLQMVPKDIFERLALARLPFGISIRTPLQDGLEVYPEFDHLYLLMGVSHLQEPDSLDLSASQRYIQKAFEVTKDPAGLNVVLARLLQSLGGYYHTDGQYERAIKYYQEALKFNSKYPVAYYNMGNAFHAIGRENAAIDAFQKAVSLQPTYTSALQNIANIFFEKGDFKNARSIYEILASSTQNSTHYYNLGVVNKQMGELFAAEKALEQARNLAPEDLEVLMRLGEVLYEQKASQKAIHIFREIVEKDSNHVLGYYNLGTLLVEESRIEEAVVVFQKAAKLDPRDQDVQVALAFVYEKSGRVQDALEIYHSILEHDPNHEIAQRRINLHP